MIGQIIAHYRITEKLGAGGMGEVYRAKDTNLERDVALKILPPQQIPDPAARTNLLREARTASALNHPNICTVFDAGESNGLCYIAMELVDGKPLSAVISSGSLSSTDVIRYGIQISGALAHAHANDVIHRDLKSANIMLAPSGNAKVLDFGLAKRSRDALTDATLSHSEVTTTHAAGTLAYMAPEVLRGEPATSASDVWALGVVLFEMTAGRRPFHGATPFDLSSSILRDPPPPLPPDTQPGLAAIIHRCLQKEPSQRYAGAGEVRASLEMISSQAHSVYPLPVSKSKNLRRLWITLAAAAPILLAAAFALDLAGIRTLLIRPADRPAIRSIAVLPLTNMSRDPEQDYFASGMTDALTTELSRIQALRVISRTSAMQFKDTQKLLPAVGRELNVDAVVEGSVLREGGKVRISVQLRHAPTETNLWAQTYDREISSILTLQGEVARAIAREIQVAVTPEEEKHLARAVQVDQQAHELTLKGNFLLSQENTNRDAIEKSIQLFREAVQIDPGYTAARVGLAKALLTRSGVGYLPMLEACRDFRPTASQAIDIDPQNGEAYAIRADARYFCDWDWPGALADAERGVQLTPGSPLTHITYARILSTFGRHTEALEHGRIAQQLDPLSPTIIFYRATSLARAHRFQEAEKTCRDFLAISPEQIFVKFQLAQTLAMQDKFGEAIPLLLSRKVPTADTNWMLGYSYARSGQKPEARRILNFLLERRKEIYVWPSIIGLIYVGLGEKDKAFELFDQSMREHDFWIFEFQESPLFDPIRNDPRFQEYIRRLNFPKP